MSHKCQNIVPSSQLSQKDNALIMDDINSPSACAVVPSFPLSLSASRSPPVPQKRERGSLKASLSPDFICHSDESAIGCLPMPWEEKANGGSNDLQPGRPLATTAGTFFSAQGCHIGYLIAKLAKLG